MITRPRTPRAPNRIRVNTKALILTRLSSYVLKYFLELRGPAVVGSGPAGLCGGDDEPAMMIALPMFVFLALPVYICLIGACVAVSHRDLGCAGVRTSDLLNMCESTQLLQ